MKTCKCQLGTNLIFESEFKSAIFGLPVSLVNNGLCAVQGDTTDLGRRGPNN